MATRSTIAVIHDNGTVSQIYCHWDGYVQGVGRKLALHYSKLSEAERLVELGDLSVLGSEIGEKHDFEGISKDIGDVCTAYGRDRGEQGTDARVFPTIENYLRGGQMEEYNYLFQSGEWFYAPQILKNFRSVNKSIQHLEA
jgi:hypothetical protein